MPELIACIECQKRIRVPDEMVGKRIRCPNCGTNFVALADEPVAVSAAPVPGAAAEFAFAAEPAARVRTPAAPPTDPDTWGPVLTGVNLQLLAHFLFVAGGLFQALILFIYLVRDEPKKIEVFERFLSNCLTVSYVLLMLNWLLALAASGCFLTAPVKYGARGWAAACGALLVVVLMGQDNALRYLNMGLTATSERTFSFMPTGPHQRGGVVSLGLGFMLISLPELMRLIVLPLFLRALGRNTSDSGLANFGLYASFAAPVLFGLALALDLMLSLIEPSTSTNPKARHEEEQALALVMLFLHSLALFLVLLTNLLILFRARTAVQKALRSRTD